jgi:nucleoside-diphosphate-sugar epimerase/predicted dehydrogenase
MPRLAIIGCGAVVEYRLIDALRRIGWTPSVLVDICSRRLDCVASKIGRKGASVLKAVDWRSVAGEFDVAIVSLPNFLHGSTGLALLDAGKHVFMEKPLALSSAECQAMISAADKARVTLSVGLARRYLQVAHWTKALLESNTIGEVKHFEAREGSVFNWNMASAALLQSQLTGGGVLIDTGVHTVDLLLWWFGDIELINYRDDSQGGVEADCVVEGRLASGGTGKLELSRTRNLSNSILIEGTRGFVEVHLQENKVIAGSPNTLAFKHGANGIANMPLQAFLFDAELKDFRTSTVGECQVGVSAREGARSVEFIERCYRARQPLSVPWSIISSSKPPPAATTFPSERKVLVTGATGFIGCRLVERLVHDNGIQVRCLVRSLATATRVARFPVQIMLANLNNSSDVNHAVRGVDYVFHCAFDRQSRAQNIEGLRNLIAACAAHKVLRIVHVSSSAVYEPFPDGPFTEQTREGDRSSFYVRTKLDLEKIVFEVARELKVPATIVQPTMVYGPFCETWTNKPAENLIYGNVVLPDYGEGVCNAVYVDDVVDGLLLAAISPTAVGERYILSGPQPITWARFFTCFAQALGVDPPSYWPYERILKEASGITKELRLGLTNPRRIIKLLMRMNLAARTLKAGLALMPMEWQRRSKNYYGHRGFGEPILPHPQLLALYCSKGFADCNKARLMLGYQPRFEFKNGMIPTGEYLRWAFEDLRRAVTAKRAQSANHE